MTAPRARRPTLSEAALALLLVAFGTYAAVFVWRTTFDLGGERYATLFDDAMVSMQYARNLASGHGLVWNAGGERVEGFSNPLWVLVMAAVHLLPLPASKTSLVIQAIAAALLVLDVVLVHRLASRVTKPGVTPFLAALLTAFYWPLNLWSLLGMEVSLLTFLVTSAALGAVASLDDGRLRLAPFLILGAATFVRLDAAVPLVAVTATLAALLPASRRRCLATGGSVLAGSLAVQTAARLAYYGDWLPNTYYLKLTGTPLLSRIARGLEVLGTTASNFGWPLLAAALALVLLRRRPWVLLVSSVVAGQCAYSVWVGGDAWEHLGGANRYLAIAAPLLFVLVAAGLVAAADRLSAVRSATGPRPAARGLLCAALALAALASVDELRSLKVARERMLLSPMEGIGLHRLMVRRALAIKAFAPREATVAVVWAGIFPYFGERPAVDILGKCDRFIARSPARAGEFVPGHVKWDYAHSLGALAPDVVAQLWDLPSRWDYLILWNVPPEARRWVSGRYVRVTVGDEVLLAKPWVVAAGGRSGVR